MTTGTKSLLFGVHQFAWHPLTVYIAWVRLYKELPNWRELICIIIHDWGYWGKTNMDDKEGEKHPEWAARIALLYLDSYSTRYRDLCLLHSRHYARVQDREPSKLCWADKLSVLYDPWWFYLPRAWMSGELFEYRMIAASGGYILAGATHRRWYAWLKSRLITIAKERRGDAVPYVNPDRSL